MCRTVRICKGLQIALLCAASGSDIIIWGPVSSLPAPGHGPAESKTCDAILKHFTISYVDEVMKAL